jgi:hypothetical protein
MLDVRKTRYRDHRTGVAKLRSDFPFYAEANLKITDEDGRLVPLRLNRMQRVLWLIILEQIRLGRPVRIYLVKARQLGSTTFFSAVLFWLSTMNKHKRVIGIAQDDDAAENINLRWQNYYWNSNRELRPRFRKMNPKAIYFATPLKDLKNWRKGMSESEVMDDIGLDSLMVVKTADSVQLGRSFTYNGAHLTEFCIWPLLGIDVKSRMIALKQAIPDRPNTCIFIESTAQGDNYGRKFWDDKKNGFVKVFVSWLAADKYRLKLGLSKKYFALSEDDDDQYGDEVKERRNIIKQLMIWYPRREWGKAEFPQEKLFESYESWLNHESYCRLAWRRRTIDRKCEGDKDEFKREYPTTIQDAFAVSSKSVFGAIRLLEAKEFLTRSRIRPGRFSYIHPQDVRKASFREIIKPFSKGKLRIYELPKPGEHYVCGADAAQGGPDSDDSSFVIFRLSAESGKLVEVASYNDRIEATEFAGLLYRICKFYNSALLGVERNDKAGYSVLEILRKEFKYNRLYWHRVPLKNKKTTEVQWGWNTDGPSRQVMITDGITWFTSRYIQIRSREILEQMDTFVENPETGKIAASGGNHDDLVMAMLIAGQMSKYIHNHTTTPATKVPAYSLEWWMRQLENSRSGVGSERRRRPKGRKNRSWFDYGKGQRRKVRYATA